MYYLYVLESIKDSTTYIGYTEDIDIRLAQHNAEKTKSIKHKLPVRLAYKEEYAKKM